MLCTHRSNTWKIISYLYQYQTNTCYFGVRFLQRRKFVIFGRKYLHAFWWWNLYLWLMKFTCGMWPFISIFQSDKKPPDDFYQSSLLISTRNVVTVWMSISAIYIESKLKLIYCFFPYKIHWYGHYYYYLFGTV